MTTWKAHNDKILVKETPENKQLGGINLNALANDFVKGTVVSTGNKVTDKIKEGDTVTYKKSESTPIDLDGENFKIISEREVYLNQ